MQCEIRDPQKYHQIQFWKFPESNEWCTIWTFLTWYSRKAQFQLDSFKYHFSRKFVYKFQEFRNNLIIFNSWKFLKILIREYFKVYFCRINTFSGSFSSKLFQILLDNFYTFSEIRPLLAHIHVYFWYIFRYSDRVELMAGLFILIYWYFSIYYFIYFIFILSWYLIKN